MVVRVVVPKELRGTQVASSVFPKFQPIFISPAICCAVGNCAHAVIGIINPITIIRKWILLLTGTENLFLFFKLS
jgi:hypothetical protein